MSEPQGFGQLGHWAVAGLPLATGSPALLTYTEVRHCRHYGNPPSSFQPHPAPVSTRFTKIQNTKMTMKRDGISSLQYRLVEVSRQPMYTNITVEIGRPPPRLARG